MKTKEGKSHPAQTVGEWMKASYPNLEIGMNSTEKAALMRSLMRAGRNPEKAASILSAEVLENPDAFPAIEKIVEELCGGICDEVMEDMPHLADDPEAIADEAMRRLEARLKKKAPGSKT